MPGQGLFRIIAGNSSRASAYPGQRRGDNNNASSNNNNNAAAASSSNTTDSNTAGSGNNSSRGLYPGARSVGASASAVSSNATTSSHASQTPMAAQQQQVSASSSSMLMPTGTPRVGPLHSNSTPSAGAAIPSATADPNSLILRGSNVAPPSSSSQQQQQSSNPAGGNTSLGSNSSNPAAHAPPSNNTAAGTTNRGPETTRPGSYAVTRTASGPAQVYRVTVPAGVSPGSEFTVHAGPRRVRVRCPNTSRPGQSLQITLPPEPITHHTPLKMAALTAAVGSGGGGSVRMSDEVSNVNKAASESGGTAQTFLVTIPPNIYPGMQFTVDVSGQRFVVTCPPNAGPNMKVRIVPPTQREEPMAAPKTQVFEVAVPPGVGPNEPFALVANGQRVLVTCPPNVTSGQKIRFQLPVQELLGHIQLSYESATGGWCRTIRVTDMKFQWVRVNNNNSSASSNEDEDNPANTNNNSIEEGGARASALDVEAMHKFDFKRSAYVRKVTYLEGNDARMRTGAMELVPAKDAVVDSKLVVHNRTLVSYADIAAVQGKSLEEKTQWFHNICNQLTGAWEDGHIKMAIRRRYLLLDSVDAVMSLGRDDLRKRWRFEFLGEPGIDSGGVTREWFQLVTEQIMDPAFGLWKCSVNNQACVTINPSSAISCPDDHLVYFRFLGRVLGRALFDRQIVKGHMARHVFKHLLGWPITFEDLSAQDEEYYNSLKKLAQMEDVTAMCLDFTVTEENMGSHDEVELIKGGAMKEVTKGNLQDYLEANLRYQMLGRCRSQMTELLLGFFDIVPESALTVFDSNELELILCGLPTIEMDDWEANSIYSGVFENKGRQNQVVQWFWETVRDDFDQEMKARLLQFVTGTSGVPSRGFAFLQGNDGNIKKFAVHGMEMGVYPRAHTCFNRIDLPIYESKKDLEEKLRAAITLSAVGFDME